MKFIRSFQLHVARAWPVIIIRRNVSYVPCRVAKCIRSLNVVIVHLFWRHGSRSILSINALLKSIPKHFHTMAHGGFWCFFFNRGLYCVFFFYNNNNNNHNNNNRHGFSSIDVPNVRDRELTMRAITHFIDNEFKTITVLFMLCMYAYMTRVHRRASISERESIPIKISHIHL